MALLKTLQVLCALTTIISVSTAAPTHHRSDDDNDDTPLPLVIWHGLGDTFGNPGLQEVAALAEAVNPGTLTYIVKLGATPNADRQATFLGNLTEQVAQVCEELAAHPILSTAPAIDALGFSQGGQFLRAYVQRCNNPPVRNLVTFGSQHNGIVDFKDCGATDWLCRGAMALLRGNTWSSFIQGRLVPAQYYRSPAADQYEKYLDNSNFLADINNERILKNKTYKENLAKLDNLVLYMFADDTTVIPKESAWFEDVNGTEITPLRARKMYSEDWIGLRELDRKGGLHFKTTPGDHMTLPETLLNDTFKEYFGPMKSKSKSKGWAWLADDL